MINPQEMGRQLLSEVPSAAPPGVVSPTGFHSKRWVDEAEAKAAAEAARLEMGADGARRKQGPVGAALRLDDRDAEAQLRPQCLQHRDIARPLPAEAEIMADDQVAAGFAAAGLAALRWQGWL